MQRIFQEETPWQTPWMSRVLPRVKSVAEHRPERTVFTRFITAAHPEEGVGTWARYWTRWAALTRQRMDPGLLELIPELAALCPPARLVDKHCYSPWRTPELGALLTGYGCNTLIVTGGETDVCVLATVLGAVDRGHRVIVVMDALCSSSDQTHDAVMTIYGCRYTQQVELVATEELLEAWR